MRYELMVAAWLTVRPTRADAATTAPTTRRGFNILRLAFCATRGSLGIDEGKRPAPQACKCRRAQAKSRTARQAPGRSRRSDKGRLFRGQPTHGGQPGVSFPA